LLNVPARYFLEISLLKYLGTSVNSCGRRLLILQCNAAHLPRLYSEVRDRHFRPAGRVVEIFGNIKFPYASVLCYNRPAGAVGEKFFAK